MPDEGVEVDDVPVELEREKNVRDEEPPDPPLPDDDELVERQGSPGLGVADIAAPGAGCALQSLRGIIAKLVAPTVVAPMSSSATWDERFTAASQRHRGRAEDTGGERDKAQPDGGRQLAGGNPL